jgi:hypothetical protein
VTTARITLICDSGTADGALYTRGALRIVPSFTRLGDTADQVLIEQAGVRVTFPETGGPPSAQLFPCDLIGPQDDDGPGWRYTVYYDGCPGNPPSWSFLLLSTGGSTQRLSGLAPADAPVSPWDYVTSFNGRAGPVTAQGGDYTAAEVGADAAGAAATAQAAAEAFATSAVSAETARAEAAEGVNAAAVTAETGRAQAAETANAGAITAETSRAETAEALKAPLASPALTGSPTAPTQTAGDTSAKLATDAFVATATAYYLRIFAV